MMRGWRCASRNERCGRFRRIFPSPHAFTYRQFFEEVRPLNELLADHMFHLTAVVRVAVGRACVSHLPSVCRGAC